MASPGFWGNLGSSLGQYEAQKSPIGAALYNAMLARYKGGQQTPAGSTNPSTATQYGAVHPEAGPSAQGSSSPTASTDPASLKTPQSAATPQNLTPLKAAEAKDTTPAEPDTHEGISFGPPPAAAPSVKISIGGKSPATGGYGSSSGSGGGIGTSGSYWDGPMGMGIGGNAASGSYWDPVMGQDVGGSPAGSSSSTFTPDPYNPNDPNNYYTGDPGNGQIWDGSGGYGSGGDTYGDPNYLGDYARGGIAPSAGIARIAERGPEMAAGQVVHTPSIVKLNKGDSVIPLKASPTNKLQPDLLEGHVAAPSPAGVHYSRYKSYGQGRGLMR